MSKLADTSKTLQKIEEGQGDVDLNLIVAEVFDDIRKNPSRYRNEPDHMFNVGSPHTEDGKRHDGSYLADVGNSVLILGPEDPQGLVDLIRYVFSKKRRKVRMKFPVEVELNKAQAETFEELMEKVTKWRQRRDQQEKIDRFRQQKVASKGSTCDTSDGGIVLYGGSGNGGNIVLNQSLAPPAGQISYNSSGEMLVADGRGNFLKC